MKTHQEIDARSLAMARAVADKIDADPERKGLKKAKSVCARWCANRPTAAHGEWKTLLEQPWDRVRSALLDPSEEGKRRRQSSPFCGVLTPRERWAIFKSWRRH
jgi:hypothetical protein